VRRPHYVAAAKPAAAWGPQGALANGRRQRVPEATAERIQPVMGANFPLHRGVHVIRAPTVLLGAGSLLISLTGCGEGQEWQSVQKESSLVPGLGGCATVSV
jgi:hypothetical protein